MDIIYIYIYIYKHTHTHPLHLFYPYRFLDISDTDLHLDHVKNLCECIQLKTLKANNLTVNKVTITFIVFQM